MKRIRIIALGLAVMMTVTTLVGCGKKGENGVAGTETSTVSYSDLPGGFKAEKIGSIARDDVYTAGEGGVYYKDESGKYGIMSLDGKNDTGAKYSYCELLGKYFKVSMTTITDVDNIDTLNSIGVVDATGKEIVPMKYANVDEVNEQYIRVSEVTEKTENKDEHLVYFTKERFSLGASDGDVLFKGNWYIYDVATGKPIEGLSASNRYQITAKGNYIEYITDEEQQLTVNKKGEVLPESADLFGNGYYALVRDGVGSVYDTDDNKIFDYDVNGFVPSDSTGDYIIASKYDGEYKYVLMDKTGKVVSGEFTGTPMVYGELVHVGEGVFDFEGNKIIEGTFTSVYLEEHTKQAWFLKNDETYTLIKKDGSVIYQGTETDGIMFNVYDDFTVSKNSDEGTKYYSFKDKDFTIVNGNSVAPWLVEVSNDTTEGVVDTISGSTIISGYDDYSYISIPGVATYVYAKKPDGGIDIFAVK